MKKIIITESQYNKLGTVIKEDINDRYSRRIKTNVWGSSKTIKYKGHEIGDFRSAEIEVSFLIYDERREWGIKSLSLYDIKGPESIEVEVDYYIDEDTEQEALLTLPLDWENNLEIDKMEGNEMLSIADDIDIEIVIGEDGKMVAKMSLDVYSF